SLAFAGGPRLQGGAGGLLVERDPDKLDTNVVRLFDSWRLGKPDLETSSVAVTRDGWRAFVGGREVVELWDPNGTRIWSAAVPDALAVALSPDGKRGLSGHVDHTVRLWDIPARCELRRSREGFNGPVVALALGPDGP